MTQEIFSLGDFNLIHSIISGIGYLLPIPLGFLAFFLWTRFKKENFPLDTKWVLLEILVPRDVIKTPAAMELIFSNTFAPKLWFSLELVSIDGRVHFYIRTPIRIRDLVETQVYAQYPQAKVVEVEDYAFNIPQFEKKGDWYMWGCEFVKKKEDFLPIKTHKGFGDDMKTGIKEEYKIDPITPTIEFLGSLGKGQQMWVQILVKQSSKKYYSEAKSKLVDFYDAAQEYMIKLHKPYTKVQKEGSPDIDMKTPETLKPVIKAINDQLGLNHYDCGIRVVTLSDKRIVSEEQFDNLRRSSRLIFRQFSLPFSNELKRVNSTEFEFAWTDPLGVSIVSMKKQLLDFYRMRTFFHAPLFSQLKPEIFVLSEEELSTLYHFPGMVSEAPSFKRIESKIAKPPSNLPI